jgi:hypothetical protein
LKALTRLAEPGSAGPTAEVRLMLGLWAVRIEENERLKRQKADERFTPTDTADNVAMTIVGMFSPSKAEDVARRILAKLKQRDKTDAKAKAKKADNPKRLVFKIPLG